MYDVRRKVQHHHRNQIEMWGFVDDVPADDFGDEGAGDDGIQQIQSHRHPGGLEGEESPLPWLSCHLGSRGTVRYCTSAVARNEPHFYMKAPGDRAAKAPWRGCA